MLFFYSAKPIKNYFESKFKKKAFCLFYWYFWRIYNLAALKIQSTTPLRFCVCPFIVWARMTPFFYIATFILFILFFFVCSSSNSHRQSLMHCSLIFFFLSKTIEDQTNSFSGICVLIFLWTNSECSVYRRLLIFTCMLPRADQTLTFCDISVINSQLAWITFHNQIFIISEGSIRAALLCCSQWEVPSVEL